MSAPGGSGAAVWYVARRVLGRSRWGTVVLVAVIAVACGVTMAAVAGGRRAATSYDRFREWSDGADMSILVGGDSVDSAGADDLLTRIAAFPEIESSTRLGSFEDVRVVLDGEPLPYLTMFPYTADLDAPALGRVKVVDGRLPRRDAVGDAVISFATARYYDVDVGDSLDIVLPSGTTTVSYTHLTLPTKRIV